jgi:hypothetical protein
MIRSSGDNHGTTTPSSSRRGGAVFPSGGKASQQCPFPVGRPRTPSGTLRLTYDCSQSRSVGSAGARLLAGPAEPQDILDDRALRRHRHVANVTRRPPHRHPGTRRVGIGPPGRCPTIPWPELIAGRRPAGRRNDIRCSGVEAARVRGSSGAASVSMARGYRARGSRRRARRRQRRRIRAEAPPPW